MHYLIKQEKCDKCDGSGRKPVGQVYFNCTCTNGYIETRVSADEWLLERLRSLQWDDCTGRLFVPQYFENPRFKGA